MDINKLTPTQRQVRLAVRAFLLLATPGELKKEKEISLERGDRFRAECVQELIDEET